MSFEKRYTQLNDRQRQAVDTIDGPVMVIAGPGSGKTELLGMRVANILQKTDTSPSSILCITFTDAAAANMRQRLIGLIGQTAYDVSINTFHSLGTEIIQRYGDYFYDGAEVMPADAIMTLEIITEILKGLPKSNPLASFHEEQGYVHAKKVIDAINDIKKGALTPDLFSTVVEDTMAFQQETTVLLQTIFADKITKKSLDLVPAFVEGIAAAIHGDLRVLPTMHTLKERLMMDLKPVLAADSTKPLTEWKKQYTEKDEKNQTVWKELKHHKKYAALAEVYAAYQEALKRRALVDFNDMLMRVVDALKASPDLRFTLQERFLYILIDEFQDTNGIQMELARLLAQTQDPTYRPNILAVGDDDQAIYKFQGANVDNLLGFRDLFPDPEYIVLDKNYRSTPQVLETAEEVISASEERLGSVLPGLTKELCAANTSLQEGVICAHRASSEEEEAAWVAEEIKRLIESGTPAEEIAVLGRNHAHLQPVTEALLARGLPFMYERSNNVLNAPAVEELLRMLEFTVSLLNPYGEPRDDLLSSILSQPCWHLPTLRLWELSRDAFASRKSWIDTMLVSEDTNIRHIALFFLEAAKHAKVSPVESIFDFLTGTRFIEFMDGEETIEFQAPFRHHHFSGINVREEEIQLLAELRGLLKAIRSYLPQTMILAQDFIATLRLHKQYNIAIPADELLLRRQHGLKIMTVHKAKGLEFEHVFLVQCTQEAWNKKRGGMGDIALPKFLGLRAQPETESDFRKLFFVALTRAKRFIHMSYAKTNAKGKEMVPLRYLEGEKMPEQEDVTVDLEDLAPSLALSPEPFIFTGEARNFLSDILEDYSLSATHFNSFLDVSNGGPEQFVIDHLLRFPSRKQPAASFGTAMHCSLERLHKNLREHKTLLSSEELQNIFEYELKKQRLSDDELTKYLEHGKEQLRVYLHERGHELRPEDIVERNFRNDHVHLGEACITGKIDKMHVDDESRTIAVFDWKTGRAQRSWQGKQDYEKHKLWAYRNQLMFYKLLVENAPQYRGKYVVTQGCLEFVEHRDGQILLLPMQFSHEEMSRFARLVEVVFKKIMTQDFPDISSFSADMKGVAEFEAFLLDSVQQPLLI